MTAWDFPKGPTSLSIGRRRPHPPGIPSLHEPQSLREPQLSLPRERGVQIWERAGRIHTFAPLRAVAMEHPWEGSGLVFAPCHALQGKGPDWKTRRKLWSCPASPLSWQLRVLHPLPFDREVVPGYAQPLSSGCGNHFPLLPVLHSYPPHL